MCIKNKNKKNAFVAELRPKNFLMILSWLDSCVSRNTSGCAQVSYDTLSVKFKTSMK